MHKKHRLYSEDTVNYDFTYNFDIVCLSVWMLDYQHTLSGSIWVQLGVLGREQRTLKSETLQVHVKEYTTRSSVLKYN